MSDIYRQTCSHDLAYKLREDIRDLGELTREITLANCLRCNSNIPINNRTYVLKDDPKLYLHRRRGNDGVYQSLTVYARLDKERSNL